MHDFFKGDESFTGSKGLVYVGDKILTYRRDANAPRYPLYIDLPGGGAQADETPFLTFRRELMEEFGLPVERSEIVYHRRYESKTDSDVYGWFVVAKLPHASACDIRFGSEGLEYKLMTVDEYMSLSDTWPAHQERVADYLYWSKRNV